MATPLDTLKRLRPKFPTPMSKVQLGAFLNEVAWEHRTEGFALLGKPSGNNCPQPRTGKKVSCDYLIHGPTKRGWDVLVDSEGEARPTWNGPEDLSAAIASGSRSIVPPVQPVGPTPDPDPPPPPPPNPDPDPDPDPDPEPPPPPPPPPSHLEERMRLLEAQVDDLETRLMAHAAKPLPAYRGTLFGAITITSHPVQD